MRLYRGRGWSGASKLLLWFWLLLPPYVQAAPSVTHSILHEPVFDGEIHVYSSGPASAPAVVLLHGIGDKAASDWTGLMAALAPNFRVISFDLPGFGQSSKDNQAYTPKNYAAVLHYLVQERVGKQPFFLVAHSMGGVVALRYATLHPQSIRAMVLIDVPGILHHLAYSRYLGHFGIDYFVPRIYRAQNDHLNNLLSTLFSKLEWAKPAPEIILSTPSLRQKFLAADPGRIAGLALVLESFSGELHQLSMPTLVLWGGRDELAPLRNGQVLSATLGQSQLEVFAESGHTPMDDVPDAFIKRVLGFLNAPRIDRPNDILSRPFDWPETKRTGSCNGLTGKVFEGDFQSLDIRKCRDVIVRHARVRDFYIADAQVNIEDSQIGGSDSGLLIDDARVNITSSAIEGRVAIIAIASHLDIAGSRINGSQAALEARRNSEVIFSLTKVDSPHYHGSLHERRIIGPGDPL